MSKQQTRQQTNPEKEKKEPKIREEIESLKKQVSQLTELVSTLTRQLEDDLGGLNEKINMVLESHSKLAGRFNRHTHVEGSPPIPVTQYNAFKKMKEQNHKSGTPPE